MNENRQKKKQTKNFENSNENKCEKMKMSTCNASVVFIESLLLAVVLVRQQVQVYHDMVRVGVCSVSLSSIHNILYTIVLRYRTAIQLTTEQPFSLGEHTLDRIA